MKRYHLFFSKKGELKGGYNDFVNSFDYESQALNCIDSILEKTDITISEFSSLVESHWYQLYDSYNNKIIFENI